MIESYFWAKGSEKFLINSRSLSTPQRTNIVNVIVDFMVESFGIDATPVQRAITAAAAVVLFPGLEFRDGDSTVCINFLFFLKSF